MSTLLSWMLACSGDDVGEMPIDETGTPQIPVVPEDTATPPEPPEPEVVTYTVAPRTAALGTREPVVVVFDAPMDASSLALTGSLVDEALAEVTWSAADGNDPARVTLSPTSTWTASAAHTVEMTVVSVTGVGVEVFATFEVATQLGFVTSEQGSGDLGSWSTAGGAQGRAAGDAICTAEARQAGLTGAFRALLNDGQADAACTLYGLDGQLADGCGVETLPTPVTWQRPDGLPLGDSQQLVDDFLLHPFDTLAAGSTFVGATWYGTRPLNCGDWTRGDSDVQGRFHVTADTRLRPATDVRAWNAPTCDAHHPLMCVQFSESVPLSPPRTEGLRVFVSSASGTGDLGSWPEAQGETGLAAGDAICQTLATDAGLTFPDRFRALLSDPSIDAVDRFPETGPWVRADGALLGQTFADLLVSATSRPLDETGTVIETDPLEWFHQVWTGTDTSGNANGNDQCASWTDGTSNSFTTFGNYAMAGGFGTSWPGFFACENVGHLYCVELPPGRF